jgi:hypothetical protein
MNVLRDESSVNASPPRKDEVIGEDGMIEDNTAGRNYEEENSPTL